MGELIVAGGDVVTMNPNRDVFLGGAVLIDGQLIVEVGATDDVRAGHPNAEVLDASGCVVTPGLINAHQHFTGDPLVACCIPDNISSDEAIYEWAVPIHQYHSAEDDEIAATLTALQCLRHGTTTMVEAGTVANPERLAAALERTGARGTVGRWGWDVPDVPYSGPVSEVLAGQRALVEQWPSGERIEGWVTLVGHAMASDELLVGAFALSRELDVRMTMHMSPTPADSRAYRERGGMSAIEHLAHLDVLGPNLVISHAVWLDDAEFELLLEHDVAIAYCPWAYLRLGQGVTLAGRHIEFARRGGRLALGADAANAGDHRDMLSVASLAAGLERDRDEAALNTAFAGGPPRDGAGYGSDVTTDPAPDRRSASFGAAQAFELATISGADAIGMSDRIGSIEPGKAADIVIFDATHIDWGTRGDLALQLVWGNVGHTVRDVIVDGELVIESGRSTMVDEASLLDEAVARKTHLLKRTGITLYPTWPQQ